MQRALSHLLPKIAPAAFTNTTYLIIARVLLNVHRATLPNSRAKAACNAIRPAWSATELENRIASVAIQADCSLISITMNRDIAFVSTSSIYLFF